MPKERLLRALSESELVESENDFDNERLKKITKDINELRDRFSKPQIKDIRKSFYDIKYPKNLSTQKIKGIEENLLPLEKHLSNLQCRPQDDFEYKNEAAFNEVVLNQSTNEDYYKPIKTADSFDNKNNYVEYQSKGDKEKQLSIKEYLYMIIPYLRDIINDHKARGKLKVHSSNEVIVYETEGKGKTQLSMEINFVFSKDSDEVRKMHTKGDNIDILMGSETYDIIKELFKSLLQKFQEGLEESMKGSEFIIDSVNLLEYI